MKLIQSRLTSSRISKHLRLVISRVYSLDVEANQKHRSAVLDHLSRPEVELDEIGVRDIFLQFMKVKDHEMAGSLLGQVIHRQTPWVDADGKLTSLWIASVLDAKGDIGPVFDLVERSLKLPKSPEGLVCSAHLLLRQSFPRILDSANAELMDRWIALPRIRRALASDMKPTAEQLELAISRVYLKRRMWSRIGQIMAQIQDEGKEPSVALLSELFLAPLQDANWYAARSPVPPSGSSTQSGYLALQSFITNLLEEGFKLGQNAAKALESVMLEHMAPPAFLNFVEGLSSKIEFEPSSSAIELAEPKASEADASAVN